MNTNKWMVALSAVILHMCIGSVYAWSVLTGPIIAETGWSLTEVTFTFSLAILFLGTSAATLGPRVEAWGPSKSATIAAVLFAVGFVGGGVAVALRSLPLLYLTYGVVGGIGLGVGYIAPVSTLVKWFPRHKGFATGLVIMGFGFASFLAGPLLQWLTAFHGVLYAMVSVGLAYGVVMTHVSRFITPPPVNAKPSKVDRKLAGRPPVDVYNTRWFALLWFAFFVNISSGISFLAVASPMSQSVVGLTPTEAATLVGIIGVFNGAGRIAWASISDIVGPRAVYLTMFVIELVAFSLISKTSDPLAFQAIVLVIVTCYGGGFSCMPAFLSELFGSSHLSTVHGRILSAWGLAGLAGPLLIGYVFSTTGTYSMTIFAWLFAVNVAIAAYLALRAPRVG